MLTSDVTREMSDTRGHTSLHRSANVRDDASHESLCNNNRGFLYFRECANARRIDAKLITRRRRPGKFLRKNITASHCVNATPHASSERRAARRGDLRAASRANDEHIDIDARTRGRKSQRGKNQEKILDILRKHL